MMKNLIAKMRMRLPEGEMYELLKSQKRLIKQEENPVCKDLMLLIYRAKKDVYLWGARNEKRCLFRNIHLYNGLKTIFQSEDVPEKEAVRFKDLVLPVPKGNERSLFAIEFMDVILHYLVGIENISHFRDFQGEGTYEDVRYVSVNKGDIVIDCGANMGLYSAVASREGGIVYAFEPSKYIIDKYLHITAEGNPNITIVNMALSDKKGEEEFLIDEGNIGHSRLKKDLQGTRTERVIMTTIDDFVKEQKLEKVDFIKADIEGAERNMLKGAEWVLKHFAPKLSICTYHLPDDPEVLEKIIKDANSNYIVHHEAKKLYAWCK